MKRISSTCVSAGSVVCGGQVSVYHHRVQHHVQRGAVCPVCVLQGSTRAACTFQSHAEVRAGEIRGLLHFLAGEQSSASCRQLFCLMLQVKGGVEAAAL